MKTRKSRHPVGPQGPEKTVAELEAEAEVEAERLRRYDIIAAVGGGNPEDRFGQDSAAMTDLYEQAQVLFQAVGRAGTVYRAAAGAVACWRHVQALRAHLGQEAAPGVVVTEQDVRSAEHFLNMHMDKLEREIPAVRAWGKP